MTLATREKSRPTAGHALQHNHKRVKITRKANIKETNKSNESQSRDSVIQAATQIGGVACAALVFRGNSVTYRGDRARGSRGSSVRGPVTGCCDQASHVTAPPPPLCTHLTRPQARQRPRRANNKRQLLQSLRRVCGFAPGLEEGRVATAVFCSCFCRGFIMRAFP